MCEYKCSTFLPCKVDEVQQRRLEELHHGERALDADERHLGKDKRALCNGIDDNVLAALSVAQ